MLLIDAVFFVVELGAGMAVGSLALMADAFHMVRIHCDTREQHKLMAGLVE
jgi:Co/Zn/Cd efflux system component